MSIGTESRYNYAATMRIVSPAGFLLEPEHRDIRPTITRVVYPDNRQYTPLPQDNWSRIAWRSFGTGKRWWIIADFSGIIDPLSELRTQTKAQYRAQLTQNTGTGIISELHVDRPKKLARAMRIRVENLDPGALTSFDTAVLDVNESTGLVHITPVEIITGVPFALSRVSELVDKAPSLTVPTVQRALFEALDFNNPLNVLVE